MTLAAPRLKTSRKPGTAGSGAFTSTGTDDDPAHAPSDNAADDGPGSAGSDPDRSVAASDPDTATPDRHTGSPAARPTKWPTWRRDLMVFACFLVAALWVTSQIWLNPARRVASLYSSDPAQVQFFLAHSVRVVLHGEYPFFTDRLNYPDGVNLMANTAILGLGIPMVPVTLLFGPAVSFVVLVTFGLAGTASAWYYVLSRHVVRTPLAAVVGGWFGGFSPAMLSHASWHPNIISQFLLPFIVWRVITLTRSTRPVRDGVVLALLVTYQAFINEEILLFTALACGVFLLAGLAQQPARLAATWRPLATGVAVCGLVASALLAYPLYVQFAGPMAYHGLSDAVRDYGNDIAAFFSPGSPTLGGNRRANAELAPNYSEENAFFGWGLVLLAAGIVLWLRREVVVRALAFTGVLFAILSLGERVSYWNRGNFWGPWDWLVRAPLLDAVVPTRFGLITTVVVALLLALAIDRAWHLRAAQQRPVRRTVAAMLAIALVPIIPLPLSMGHRPPVPRFITSGHWRTFVTEQQTLVPVPIPDMGQTNGMRWAAATELGFKIPGGYFLAPRNGNTGDPGRFGGRPSGIGQLLERVATNGRGIRLNDRQRRRALDELRHWRAAILVLPVRQQNADALRHTVDQLVGPGRRMDDVWLWDVRALTSTPN